MCYVLLVAVSFLQQKDQVVPAGNIQLSPQVIRLDAFSIYEKAGDIVDWVVAGSVLAFVLPSL